MRAVLTAVALALVVATPPLAYAAGREARNGKPYVCNPQAECLARAGGLNAAPPPPPPPAAGRERPTGNPSASNPQAECRARAAGRSGPAAAAAKKDCGR